MLDVMGVDPPFVGATWERAAAVATSQRRSYGGWHGTRPPAHGQLLTVATVDRQTHATVARQPPRHLSSEPGAFFPRG